MPLIARSVAALTHDAYASVSMHSRSVFGSSDPLACAMSASSLSDQPSESTAGCRWSRSSLNVKNDSGAYEATHAAALAARSEYFVPFDLAASIDTGW